MKKVYPYRTTIPRTDVHTQILRGKMAYITAKLYFGTYEMDNHVGGVFERDGREFAVHYSDNTLRLDCSALIAGDHNDIPMLTEIWRRE